MVRGRVLGKAFGRTEGDTRRIRRERLRWKMLPDSLLMSLVVNDLWIMCVSFSPQIFSPTSGLR